MIPMFLVQFLVERVSEGRIFGSLSLFTDGSEQDENEERNYERSTCSWKVFEGQLPDSKLKNTRVEAVWYRMASAD